MKALRKLTAKSRAVHLALLLFAPAWAIAYFSLMPQPWEALSKGYIFILVGFLGAVIGNMTAIGGGLVFIPVLIFIYQVPAVLALKTSIITQAFGMTSGAIAWSRQKPIAWNIVFWAIPGMLIGSSISSLIIHPSPALVKGMFGPVSISLGIMLFLTTLQSKERTRNWGAGAKIATVLASLLGGILTGWVAIGEGEMLAATLMLLFGFSAAEAITLGVVLLSLNSIYLALLHTTIIGGVSWEIASFTVLGCVYGAQVAPYLARKFNSHYLKRIFAVVAILDGLLFVFQFIIWANRL